MPNIEYKISSRDYLLRAQSRLAECTRKSLFYAAFELRCGIETRMREYLAAWDHISKKKKNGWSITELGRSVEKAFKIGDKIIRLEFREIDTGNIILIFYHTPVSNSLKKSGERLGNYLHAMKVYKKVDDPFWENLHSELQYIARELEIVNKGTLLGPPLFKRGTGKGGMNLELSTGDDAEELIKLFRNKKFRVNVSYIDSFPSELEAKAHQWNFS